MERTRERLALARRALGTLEELVAVQPTSAVVRDAAIQHFEYTFEATWKADQIYLREVEGLEIGSPRELSDCRCKWGGGRDKDASSPRHGG